MNPNTLLDILYLIVVISVTIVIASLASKQRRALEMSAVHMHHDMALSALMTENWDVSAATDSVLARVDKTARQIVTQREGVNYEAWVRVQVEGLAKIQAKKP